jgi:hypothetical protein
MRKRKIECINLKSAACAVMTSAPLPTDALNADAFRTTDLKFKLTHYRLNRSIDCDVLRY